MIIALMCLVAFYFLILPRLICKTRGHKLGEGVLWKECKRCGKTHYLIMSSGEYKPID